MILAAAAERFPQVPCLIEHPDPKCEVFDGGGFGAPTRKGDLFRILFSDGVWIDP